MQVRKIVVPKTARYLLAGNPGPSIRRIWFVFHGYGQLAADFARGFKVLDDGAQLVVAPEGLHRFYLHGGNGRVGSSWMTREERLDEIRDYTAYLDMVYDEVMALIPENTAHAVQVEALGFSQGTATAWRWAVNRSNGDIRRLILWGGDVPQDNDWNKVRRSLETMELLLVAGDSDPYMKPEMLELQISLLSGNGLTARVKTFPGSHEIEPGALISLAREDNGR